MTVAKHVYAADRSGRQGHPENAERMYAIEIDGRVLRVKAASERGAEIKAHRKYEAMLARGEW